MLPIAPPYHLQRLEAYCCSLLKPNITTVSGFMPDVEGKKRMKVRNYRIPMVKIILK
jgi:hypothetical protein